MARPSKLTPDQWAQVDAKLAAGEGVRAIAKEFGVSPAIICKRGVRKQSKQVNTVAKQLAMAHDALAELPVARQYDALTLSAKLRSISDSYASAAELGAKTAHRLHALANAEVAKVDDSDVLSEISLTAMRGIGVLTKLGNDALVPASNLLAANKATIDKANQRDEPEELPPIRPQLSRDEWLKLHA